jgi:hypothetical protein
VEVTVAVSGPEDTAARPGADDLREWLLGDPELRGAVGRVAVGAPPVGSMGAVGELLPVLLAPGGVTAALAAGIVAWLQSRKGSQTVTITRSDGTVVTVESQGVRGLTPGSSGDVVQRIVDALEAGQTIGRPGPGGGSPDPGGDGPSGGGGSGRS